MFNLSNDIPGIEIVSGASPASPATTPTAPEAAAVPCQFCEAADAAGFANGMAMCPPCLQGAEAARKRLQAPTPKPAPLPPVSSNVPGAPGYKPKKGDPIRYSNPRARAVYTKDSPQAGAPVPVGTIGKLIWSGNGQYGPKYGVKTPDGGVFFTAVKNCDAVDEAAVKARAAAISASLPDRKTGASGEGAIQFKATPAVQATRAALGRLEAAYRAFRLERNEANRLALILATADEAL